MTAFDEIKDLYEIKDLCGSPIASGLTRDIYYHRLDESKIIKLESNRPLRGMRPQSHKQNKQEWLIWKALQHHKSKIRKFFCPCIARSPCYNGLIMERARICETPSEIIEKIPVIFEFLEPRVNPNSNIGRLASGQLVILDYGMGNSTPWEIYKVLKNSKMTKLKFKEELKYALHYFL